MAESIAQHSARRAVADPVTREDVPRWLREKYPDKVKTEPTSCSPIFGPPRGDGRPRGTIGFHCSIPGVDAALQEWAQYRNDRGASRYSNEAIAEETVGREIAARRLQRAATEAKRRSHEPLTPADKKEAAVRFLVELKKGNALEQAAPRIAKQSRARELPAGWTLPDASDLPFEALLWIAWWCGVLPRRPTPSSPRSMRRLMARHE